MKKSLSLLTVLLCLAVSSARADQIVFNGTQFTQTLNLKDVRKHTEYQERQIEDTCYRQVEEGTENRCDTRYREECTGDRNYVCNNTTKEECTGSNRYECHTDYQNNCRYDYQCRSVPRLVCRTHDAPGESGTTVCNTYYEQECSNQYVCDNQPVQNCAWVDDRQCRQVPTQDCNWVDNRTCTSVPYESCEDYPVYRDEPYSCTKTIRVPAGEVVDFEHSATVTVNFSDVPSGSSPNEKLSVSLTDEKVTLSSDSLSGTLLLSVNRSEQVIEKTEKSKKESVTFDVKLFSPAEIGQQISTPIKNARIEGTKLKFTAGKIITPSKVQIGLKLNRPRPIIGSKTVLDQTIIASQAALTVADSGTEIALDLSGLSLKEAIKSGTDYQLAVTLSLAQNPIEDLMNPEHLPNPPAKKSEFKLKSK